MGTSNERRLFSLVGTVSIVALLAGFAPGAAVATVSAHDVSIPKTVVIARVSSLGSSPTLPGGYRRV